MAAGLGSRHHLVFRGFGTWWGRDIKALLYMIGFYLDMEATPCAIKNQQRQENIEVGWFWHKRACRSLPQFLGSNIDIDKRTLHYIYTLTRFYNSKKVL